ncbi:lysosomal thioesterase PPT2 homolog [Acyrthosiphon pisum]|uniref:palmitoyl-CoA hydrolase n=1 Tax=Acyrthosiphon pisum TaxID=7029 RepID=A0A8R2FBU5_ACYPI|nr:lysosomal thioesterase PPT2 homolog [Acyrthosiphon pisum]XP_008187077.1 lysosomal thioesterase PPT2 homolog [Acyrthosiphon pisum]XP_008187078.1 lysosomal thioesterase PPT2 homolog [Acyrthosiphon pisum]XP_008187081.1 lysosomal thioesterase PPT2 homolog [Acyrthosiphon pisum]XP_008187082.1 lysosomal thioesterase PPT2 homolog [Acyrthosiphon pisum]XP_029341830.1 lysosomal thioesterase PPT2 homolog [Acyrthosiphon pisum]XP_029341831.1 lysosomal thioesterase PPT2 homolog [Acyrthosiphon pisum]XP_0|eukprot:XP_001942630.2 PREDICTED: lysosomal thioesterase PPT2 homolog [Acyrthosiphon pisum]
MTMEKSDECNNTSGQKPPYRPVVIVHGLMTGDVSTMQHLAARIAELHPGTKTYVIDRFCGLASLEPLWRQTRKLADDLLKICSLHPEGVHIIGYSQGGLIARGMIEEYGTEHNVRTFVSLSSPQGGQYGAECFTKMFPALTARTAYELFYTRLGQRALSVANFWYDPRHRDLYLKYSVYLAVIDNVKQESSCLHLQQNENDNGLKTMMGNMSTAVTSSTTTVAETNDDTQKNIEARVAAAIAAVSAATVKISESHNDNNSDARSVTTDVDTLMAMVSAHDNYCAENDNYNSNPNIKKLGLTRLQRLVLIGGPDDGVISPWQSSQFAVLDSSGGLIPMRERRQDDVYSDNDPIGLHQLDMTDRLVEYTVPGVNHHEWHHNEKVLRECIIGWLD